MHRKFIALISGLAISTALIGASAAPARAGDDTAKFLAGLAALAIIGAAIENNRDRDDHVIHQRKVIVPPPPHRPSVHNKDRYSHHDGRPGGYRPTPPARPQVNVPGFCLQSYPGRGTLLNGSCIRQTTQSRALPQACAIGIDRGRDRGTIAYEPACLRQHGYRVSQR